MKELETLGYYEPGFLHLRVNTNEDISNLNLLIQNPDHKKLFSTFLHEYIHFLQDVSTTSGLLNANFYIDYIKEVNWEIINDGKSDFQVPYTPNNKNNIEANLLLRELYRGKTDGSNLAKYSHYEIEETSIFDKNGKEIKPPKYFVHYHDVRNYKLKKLHFGFACLKEYVAHFIQKKFLPETNHSDVPYVIAEQIVVSELPELEENKILIVALCDASLMCFHPAQMFFNTIERMKKEKFIPKNTREVYDFAFQGLQFKGELGIKNVDSLHDGLLKKVESQYFDTLESKIFQSNYKWLSYILNKARDMRRNKVDFMCKLVSDENQLTDNFFDVFHNLGTPFFTNTSENGGYVPPRGYSSLPHQPYQLLVFKQIIAIYNGSKCCSLYGFCKKSHDKNLINEHCKTAPWKKAVEANLCPVAQLWKTWGLTNETPVDTQD